MPPTGKGETFKCKRIVSPETVGRIIARIGEDYLENYADIAYLSDATVLPRDMEILPHRTEVRPKRNHPIDQTNISTPQRPPLGQ